ncbi:hypothetical protein ACJMK2_031730 [Sinanodonta woodiana]|uniref:Uncharacterized protein n=1 Tax=Sinanodonta woodiana TaxID=1069815 RepID=A0ABD3X073_SINWO
MPSAVRTPIPVGQWNEEQLGQSFAQASLTGNEIIGLHYAAIGDLTPVCIEGSNNYSLTEIEDDNLNDISYDMSSAACKHDAENKLLGESPSDSELQTTISADTIDVNGLVSREVSNSVHDLYAKINK